MKSKHLFTPPLKFLPLIFSHLFLAICCVFFAYKGGFVKHLPTPYNYESNSQYQKRITVFSELNYPKETDAVFVGDSITQNCDWSALFPNQIIINQGIGSDTSEGLLHRLYCITKCNPHKIFINIGVNDLSVGLVKSKTIDNYNNIIDYLLAELPDTEIYVIGICPVSDDNTTKINNSDIIELNQSIQEVCYSLSVSYIDLSECFSPEGSYISDGLHPSGSTYNRISDILAKYM